MMDLDEPYMYFCSLIEVRNVNRIAARTNNLIAGTEGKIIEGVYSPDRLQ
jgi:hypothetical protein